MLTRFFLQKLDPSHFAARGKSELLDSYTKSD